MMIDEWRELGFYYDLDKRLSVNQWRFYGSKKGLLNFVNLLDEYVRNPNNNQLFEHEHYGPYSYLKIITLEDECQINDNAIGGTFEDLKRLRNIIDNKLKKSQVGETFDIDKEFGEDNTASAKFFVMADNFDPVSMDELIISGRQEIANAYWSHLNETVICCFCGNEVTFKEAIPISFGLSWTLEESQNVYSHIYCFDKRLHPSVPRLLKRAE